MLPDWRTQSAEDQSRFSRFVIDQLDAMDDARASEGLQKIAAVDPAEMTSESRVAFISAVIASGAPPKVLERIGLLFGIDIAELADQLDRARAVGFEVQGADERRGRKSTQSEAFQNAMEDVPRIRALFRSLWNRRNRHERPLAEEIAALRWGLSQNDTANLIDRFRRKG